MTSPEFDDMEQWMMHGYQQGWCGPPVCAIHDGVPMSQEEEESLDEPCVHIIRLYEDQENRNAVEGDHSPSSWRATNRGWSPREG
jgi:hypothetical protein